MLIMLKKTPLVVALLWTASCLNAETGPIGSVLAHGELRVDGHAIKGSGTAFDGSVVETGSEVQSNADLRLVDGARITLHSNSHGTFYRDHFVLDRGEAEVSSPAPYRVEVDALVVRTTGSNSSARITIGQGHAIGVFAKEGHVKVAGDRGNVLALVDPQNPQSFSRDAGGNWRVSASSDQGSNNQGQDNNGQGGNQGTGHNHRHPSH
jgi:hypothetical protein